jgi:ubiquinone/menaquinone biosynthesis C-methylase UbiE
MDPLAGSSWSSPSTIAGFVKSPPNAVLLRFAQEEQSRVQRPIVLDIGCGAGRNAIPLARVGWRTVGTDLSWPMLAAAAQRARDEDLARRLSILLAPMEALPIADASVDLVVAHGIWNLARSSAQFRRAVEEGARVAKRGAALFVFTFSRATFPKHVEPVAGESFVFTQFSGEPQIFLTREQLETELKRVGFVRDPAVEFQEYNVRKPGMLTTGAAPAIYEAAFRRE